ncbi:MAG: hypothetical protein JWM53_6257 [bacterium]|nr:hypothetical protein [bacterium]
MTRLLPAALLVLVGCGHHGGGPDGGADLSVAGAFAAHDKVDILFMVDNSPGGSYGIELVQRFPAFFKALQAASAAHPASYHIGVVTSDYGAGPYVLNQGQCHPGGDGGKLQVLPAAGTSTPAACSNFTLGNGVRFIDYTSLDGTSNVMGVPDVPTAFRCMASVGEAGCGFEHVLESVYRALHDPIAENAGFLRADALLVVLFVTDEDDCSGPADGDLFDPSPDGVAKYGTLHSFRCTQFGIICGDPPTPLSATAATPGRSDCRPMTPAEGGKLIDVQQYIDFFARPGGVKADPSDVILASIAPPPAPVGVQLTMPCADQVNTPQCPILNHSCVAPTNAIFFGDPAVRLAAVVGAAATSQQTSLCDSNFTPALDDLAQKIIARLR